MPAAPRRRHASATQRLNVVITGRQRTRAVDLRLLRRVTDTLLSELLLISHADLAIHLVGTLEITRLNESFLQHAGSTDVITFDYSEPLGVGKRSSTDLHGEIFISVDEAVAQARRFRAVWQSELVRYVVHGVLHLLGFDDSTPGARRKMKRAEGRWLRTLCRRFQLTKLARPRTTR